MPIGVNLSSNTRIYRRFRSPNPLKRGHKILVPPFLRGASAVLGVSPMSDWRGLGGIEKLGGTWKNFHSSCQSKLSR